jgi:hypothetical protein
MLEPKFATCGMLGAILCVQHLLYACIITCYHCTVAHCIHTRPLLLLLLRLYTGNSASAMEQRGSTAAAMLIALLQAVACAVAVAAVFWHYETAFRHELLRLWRMRTANTVPSSSISTTTAVGAVKKQS